jgi:formate dehydrogenase (coenzyme F420) alpha subunit
MPTIKTHCKICNCRCGIIATVEDGRIVKVAGDPDCRKNDGTLCVKGRAMLELQYDPDRLLHPMARQGDGWNRLSWDGALADIAEKLLAIKSKYGPESLAIYRGMSVYSWLVDSQIRRFAGAFGTPNLFTNAGICIGAKIVATRTTFGTGVSVGGDFRNARCILLLGTNPAVTGMHRSLRIMKDILAAKADGATLIVVDPKRSETAAKAHIHATIRPGTDTALVLGLINFIIENNLYDADFVGRYTIGFDRLREAVRSYTPETVERLTWVRRETVEEIARIFAQSKPACADRRLGIMHHEHGTEACLAINILNAITGNVDVPGGLLVQTNLFDKSNPKFRELTGAGKFVPEAAPITGDHPFTTDIPTMLPDAILTGKPYPIKAMLVVGSNPLISWPNSDAVKRALAKLDLLVLVDLYRNDTAAFATHVLPAATFLEKRDMQAPNIAAPRIVQLQTPVVEPLGDARSEPWIIRALAKSLGFGKEFPETDDQVIDSILDPWGSSVADLQANPSGIEIEPASVGHYHSHPYPTASGKIELYSQTLEQKGEPGIPAYHEPSESPLSNPALAKHYPLILMTGNPVQSSYLSYLHNLPSLHRRNPENWVEIHTDAAAARGIVNGDRVTVESPRGRIQLPAKVSDRIDPRVAAIPYGWGHHYGGSWQLANRDPGENPNVLLDHNNGDRLSGMPNYKSTLCQVSKLAAA